MYLIHLIKVRMEQMIIEKDRERYRIFLMICSSQLFPERCDVTQISPDVKEFTS